MSNESSNAPAQDTPQSGASKDGSEALYPKSQEVKTEEATQEGAAKPQPSEQDPGSKPAESENQKQEAPKDESKAAVPAKYDLKLPEGSPVSAARIEGIASYAKEQGLSNEQAQALLEREHEAVSSYVQSQHETLNQKRDSWVNALKADSEIGKEAFQQSVELAKRVVDRYGTDAFKQELNVTGLGNYPELVRIFTRIGKAMSDDQLVVPGAQSSGKRDAAEILYGNSNS